MSSVLAPSSTVGDREQAWASETLDAFRRYPGPCRSAVNGNMPACAALYFTDHSLSTCLHAAAEAPPPPADPRKAALTIAALVRLGADACCADSRGRTPLHCAASSLAPSSVAALLERFADPAARDRRGQTPLHAALSSSALSSSFSSASNLAATLALLAGARPDPAALATLLRRVDAELHLLQVETDDAALRGREVYLGFGRIVASETETPDLYFVNPV